MISLRPPKIETLSSPPVVGETYRVPSVRRDDVFVPVFGPPHTDVELGQPILHYHVDIRFLTDDDAEYAGLNLADYEVHEHGGSFKFTVPATQGYRNEVVRNRVMKCIRVGPDYQTPRAIPGGGELHLNVGTLAQTGLIEDMCENERVTKCGKCPHRGTPLGHQPVVNGVVVCPAHLLKWDKATGKMIRKTKKIADGEYVYA